MNEAHAGKSEEDTDEYRFDARKILSKRHFSSLSFKLSFHSNVFGIQPDSLQTVRVQERHGSHGEAYLALQTGRIVRLRPGP